MRIMIRELRHSANKLRRVESNFGGLVAPSAVLPFFAEIAAPNIFCARQKICGYVVPEGAPIQKRHGKNRVILMRIMIRELRHSASKLRRVESNFGGLAAVGELFGSLPKLPHPIFFAQGKKYVGTMSLRACQKQRHGQSRVILMRIMIRELRHSANKLRRVESNFGGLAAVGELLPFFAEIAAPNIFCARQKICGYVVP